VGNYGQGFDEAGKQINLFGVSINDMSKGLEAAKAGFTAAGGGVKGFSAALATTGLPLIIMGVQALISAFETFEPVADAVEDTINAISNGFKGLLGGGSMSGAIKAGQELTNVMRDLEDTAAGYSIAQEQANRQIRMLQIIASDRTKSEKERLKALEDADKVQKELYDADVARNKKLLDGQKAALIAQTGLKEFELEILATTSDAADANYQKILQRAEKELKIDKKKLEEYQKTLLEKEKLDTQNLVFEEQRVKLSNRIIERGEAQAEKAQAAREKAAETAKAAKEKADQAEAARLQKLEALEAEFQLSERERLNKSFEDKLKTIQGNGERETLLRLDIVAAQEAALKKFDEDAETKRQEKEAARLLKLITDAKAAQAILADNAKMELELQKLFSKSQNDIDEEFANSNYETFKEFYDAKKKLYADDVKALDEAAKEKIAIENAVFSAAQSIQGLFTNLANAAGEQTAAGIAFQKIAAGIQIAIDTAKSITAAVAGATTAAAAGGPAAPFLIVGYIASMVGSVIGAVTQATQLLSSAGEVPAPPRFATGVIGLDGAGTATSDSIDARLSRGESVMTAKATERFAPVLAQMELAVGNRPNFQLGNRKFATGYIPTTDGGYSDRAMSNEVNNASTMAKMFSDSIAKMPQPKLVYDEFTNFVNNRNQSVNLSEL
jgi:chemotaxis protein histidine kinase CheA